MSISIGHPERYDLYCWADAPAPPEPLPDEWEMIGTDDFFRDAPTGQPRMGACFWGHLKAEYAP